MTARTPPPLSDPARAFLRYAADVAEHNMGTIPVDALPSAAIEATSAVYRLGPSILPRLQDGDDKAIERALNHAMVDRALTAREVVDIMRGLAA